MDSLLPPELPTALPATPALSHGPHRFNAEQPGGILHRAFSVFLFDEQDRLLLQQRAACKITFPEVWTNTCCSHPLYGYSPSEVDTDADIRSGSVPGVKHGAQRKLGHELGIAPEQVPPSAMHYLTRLHYCAGDAGSWEWPGLGGGVG